MYTGNSHNPLSAWRVFTSTGKIDDYLKYKSLLNAKEFGEYGDENSWDCTETAEYRGS